MDMLAQEAAISAIANATGLPRQTVYRIKSELAWAEARREKKQPHDRTDHSFAAMINLGAAIMAIQ